MRSPGYTPWRGRRYSEERNGPTCGGRSAPCRPDRCDRGARGVGVAGRRVPALGARACGSRSALVVSGPRPCGVPRRCGMARGRVLAATTGSAGPSPRRSSPRFAALRRGMDGHDRLRGALGCRTEPCASARPGLVSRAASGAPRRGAGVAKGKRQCAGRCYGILAERGSQSGGGLRTPLAKRAARGRPAKSSGRRRQARSTWSAAPRGVVATRARGRSRTRAAGRTSRRHFPNQHQPKIRGEDVRNTDRGVPAPGSFAPRSPHDLR